MKKLALIVADGTEEMEALVTADVVRRSGIELDIISVMGKMVKGSHNIIFQADKLISEFDGSDYDGIIIPGGMPGATNISRCKIVTDGLRDFMNKNKLVCAICASPAVVLSGNNIIKNRRATCYPEKDFIDMMENYTGADVEADGNLITANGPKSALKFALKICEYMGKEAKF